MCTSLFATEGAFIAILQLFHWETKL